MSNEIKKILEGKTPRELFLKEAQTLACSSCQSYDVKERSCKSSSAVIKAHSKELLKRWINNPNIGNDCSKYKGIESDYHTGDAKTIKADVKIEGDPQGIINKGQML